MTTRSISAEKASNEKRQQKNGTYPLKNSNGTDTDDADDVKFPLTSPSLWSILGCIFVAFLSFGVGVLTPPILYHQNPITSSKTSDASDEVSRQALVESKSTFLPTFVCNEDLLSQFLHEIPVPGMHLVCFESSDTDSVSLKLFPGSSKDPPQLAERVSKRWNTLREQFVERLQLRPTDELHQPWAIFSPVGEWLADETLDEEKLSTKNLANKLVQMGVILLFQGGQWIWPGVRIGLKRKIDLYTIMPPRSQRFDNDPTKLNRSAILETLSLRPLVFAVDGFLADQECDHIQERAAPKIQYSQVSLMDHDKGRPASDFRTSQSTFVNAGNDEILIDIDHRTASLVRIPRDQQEDVQVLRYGVDEHYHTHHDFFDPSLYKNDFFTQITIEKGRRNRLATVFWYLNDVEDGGETIFPRFENAPPPMDPSDCSTGLKVKPQRGKVIIFYSMTPDGTLDQLSLHGSCDVKKGVKWAANKWVWNSRMGFTFPAVGEVDAL
jgi:prolyl 4-hydroxylase